MGAAACCFYFPDEMSYDITAATGGLSKCRGFWENLLRRVCVLPSYPQPKACEKNKPLSLELVPFQKLEPNERLSQFNLSWFTAVKWLDTGVSLKDVH